jgi:hypothetical protein
MKLALLATLVTFAGSLAGFATVSAGSSSAAGDAPARGSEAVVVQHDRDCPWARAGRDA